jgi:hypothetical protein
LTGVPGDRLEVAVAVQQDEAGQPGHRRDKKVDRSGAAVLAVIDKNLLDLPGSLEGVVRDGQPGVEPAQILLHFLVMCG